MPGLSHLRPADWTGLWSAALDEPQSDESPGDSKTGRTSEETAKFRNAFRSFPIIKYHQTVHQTASTCSNKVYQLLPRGQLPHQQSQQHSQVELRPISFYPSRQVSTYTTKHLHHVSLSYIMDQQPRLLYTTPCKLSRSLIGPHFTDIKRWSKYNVIW